MQVELNQIDNQFGLILPGRSKIDVVICVCHKILSSLNSSSSICCVFLDICNSISHSALQELSSINLPPIPVSVLPNQPLPISQDWKQDASSSPSSFWCSALLLVMSVFFFVCARPKRNFILHNI